MIQSNFSETDESSSLNINKNEDHKNRGIEFLLNGGKRKQTQPFHIIFEKMVCFLNREVNVYFEFSLNVGKKKRVNPRRKNNVSS